MKTKKRCHDYEFDAVGNPYPKRPVNWQRDQRNRCALERMRPDPEDYGDPLTPRDLDRLALRNSVRSDLIWYCALSSIAGLVTWLIVTAWIAGGPR